MPCLVSWSKLWIVLLTTVILSEPYAYFVVAQVNGLQADHPTMNFSCAYTPREDSIPVFWINLDRSVVRRKYMETFLSKLGLAHERVRALSMKDMVIPKDIMQKVDNREPLCVLQTQNDPSLKENVPSSTSPSANTQSISEKSLSNGEMIVYETLMRQQKGPRKVFIKGVCGSPSNTIKELVSVASHLLAIYQACYSTKSNGKYALILEDDVWTPFDIDFEELIETVPTLNFGILQLFNSKPVALFELFRRYKKAKMLWYDRPPAFDARFLSTFSTGAYIINREVMRPIISRLIGLNNDWIHLTIIAGNTIPTCKPAICCDTSIEVNQFIHDFTNNINPQPNDIVPHSNNVNYFIDHYSPASNLTGNPVQSTYNFNESAPYCIYAPVGYQADSFLYTLAKTWALTFPLFLDGPGSEDSTIHQHHVLKQHRVAFHRIREYQIKLLKNDVELPHFVKRACPVESLQVAANGLAAGNL